jgi:hypothetical protein
MRRGKTMPDFKDIPQEDINLLRIIYDHLREAEEAMSMVSEETRDKMIAYHNRDTLPRCIYWGEQAAAELWEEVQNKQLREAT